MERKAEYEKLLAKAGSPAQCFWLALWEQNLLAIEEAVVRLGQKAWALRDSKSGRTPVEWCVFLHRHDALRAILALGSNPDDHALKTQTPLAQACQSYCVDCMEMLIQAGAELDVVDESSGATPLIVAANLAHEKHALRVANVLIQAGADKDKITADGYFALGAFAIQDYSTCIDAMSVAGAGMEAHAGDGFTALFYAVDNGAAGAAEALLRAGADFKAVATIDGEDSTPLELSRKKGDTGMSALLFSFEEAQALRERIGKFAPGALKTIGSKAVRL